MWRIIRGASIPEQYFDGAPSIAKEVNKVVKNHSATFFSPKRILFNAPFNLFKCQDTSKGEIYYISHQKRDIGGAS